MIPGDDKLIRRSNPPARQRPVEKGKESRLRRFAYELRRESVFPISTGGNPLKSLDSEK
jgi:hypothetical protein